MRKLTEPQPVFQTLGRRYALKACPPYSRLLYKGRPAAVYKTATGRFVLFEKIILLFPQQRLPQPPRSPQRSNRRYRHSGSEPHRFCKPYR